MTDPSAAVAIHWFRQDLRLEDNPALRAAADHGSVLPVYILDDVSPGAHKLGAASRWWLHHSLAALNRSLEGRLLTLCGDPRHVLDELIERYGVSAVFWNRCYEPWRIERDQRIKERLSANGVTVQSFNGSLLWEPWQVCKADGTPYRVFTPFYRKRCLRAPPPRAPLAAPRPLRLYSPESNGTAIEKLGLLPAIGWDQPLEAHWTIGERGALQRLDDFLTRGIRGYKTGRDFPARASVSRLSPHLHFGELSPNQVWHAARAESDDADIEHFCTELAWREFSYNLLYHFPELPSQNLQAKFDHFPWCTDPAALRCWQRGRTGIPIVDAGMRELWQTAYMHNRVRMIVGSFLVKNLLIHWHAGERWFWDCLADADLANNSASWQWIAGCGADAAPYFRIFNPVAQARKFDPDGAYIRRYVPELELLPDKFLFEPWTAPANVLRDAGVALGKTYPLPIVDLKASRERALKAFKSIKDNNPTAF